MNELHILGKVFFYLPELRFLFESPLSADCCVSKRSFKHRLAPRLEDVEEKTERLSAMVVFHILTPQRSLTLR